MASPTYDASKDPTLEEAARIIAEAAGLTPEQAPGLAEILRLVREEGRRRAFAEAALMAFYDESVLAAFADRLRALASPPPPTKGTTDG